MNKGHNVCMSVSWYHFSAIQSAFKNHANDNWTATDKQLYCILCDITPDMYSPEDCMEIVERAGDDSMFILNFYIPFVSWLE